MEQTAVASALELQTIITAHRLETEENRCLASPVVEKFVEGRFARLCLSDKYGGVGLPATEVLEIFETLACADASAPWFLWNNALVCLFSRFLSDEVRAEIFSNPRTLFAQSTRPEGKAVVEADGFRISGRWSLVSGCELADHLFLTCLIEENGSIRMSEQGQPETQMIMVSKNDFEIQDTWNVGGLRGTGSHHVVVSDAFTPLAFSITPSSETAPSDCPWDRMPVFATLATGLSAQALGVAQCSLDTIAALARSKITKGSMPDLGDRPQCQSFLAVQAAALAAARSQLHTSVLSLWEDAQSGTRSTPEKLSNAYGAAIFANAVARETVNAAYVLGGTSSLYVDCPIERAHRDIHAMLQHLAAQPAISEDAGRVRVGLDPLSSRFAI